MNELLLLAVCVNQTGDTARHRALADEVARRWGAATVPEDFDLFTS